MKLSIRGKGLALAVASAALVAVPFITPAEAATSSVTCAKVTSAKLTPKGAAASVFASCTPAALKAGGKGATTKTPPPGSASGSVGFKITWNGGKGTTTAAVKFKQNPTIGKCPKSGGYKRLTVKGTVKAATGAAKTITKLNEPVTASQCVVVSGANAGKSMLEPGTKFKL
jgi:hypothetical protein